MAVQILVVVRQAVAVGIHAVVPGLHGVGVDVGAGVVAVGAAVAVVLVAVEILVVVVIARAVGVDAVVPGVDRARVAGVVGVVAVALEAHGDVHGHTARRLDLLDVVDGPVVVAVEVAVVVVAVLVDAVVPDLRDGGVREAVGVLVVAVVVGAEPRTVRIGVVAVAIGVAVVGVAVLVGAVVEGLARVGVDLVRAQAGGIVGIDVGPVDAVVAEHAGTIRVGFGGEAVAVLVEVGAAAAVAVGAVVPQLAGLGVDVGRAGLLPAQAGALGVGEGRRDHALVRGGDQGIVPAISGGELAAALDVAGGQALVGGGDPAIAVLIVVVVARAVLIEAVVEDLFGRGVDLAARQAADAGALRAVPAVAVQGRVAVAVLILDLPGGVAGRETQGDEQEGQGAEHHGGHRMLLRAKHNAPPPPGNPPAHGIRSPGHNHRSG